MLSFSNVGYETENLRYLLWNNRDLPREAWPRTLAGWIGCDQVRATRLLDGAMSLSSAELNRLVQAHEYRYSEQDLEFTRLLAMRPEEILSENLQFLLGALSVTQRQVAKKIGVNEVSLSRWIGGKQMPHPTNLVSLADYFKLAPDTDLATHAVFLAPGPINDYQMRKWVHDQVEIVPGELLEKIFEALRLLLQTNERS